jgi:[ribosomal protein S5]-alanine N-acetyltransferase
VPSFLDAGADLTTDRLVLRPWTTGEVAAVLGGAPVDAPDDAPGGDRPAHWAEDFPAEGDQVIVGLFAEHPAWLGTYGHRQIIERESGLVVGSIGLFWPPGDGEVEIGYGIVASRRGRGYAAEATRAVAEHALTAPGVHTVYATVELSNPASVRVLEKAGFERSHVDPEQNTARYDATRR